MAKPFKVTPERFAEILDSLRSGITLAQYLEDQEKKGFSLSRDVVTSYANADSARKAALSLAREDGAHALAESIISIADSDPNPQRALNRMKARQWLASKLKPKDYGDKLDIDVRGQIDIQSAVLAGRRRIQTIEHKDYIDATTTDKQSDVALIDHVPAVDPFS